LSWKWGNRLVGSFSSDDSSSFSYDGFGRLVANSRTVLTANGSVSSQQFVFYDRGAETLRFNVGADDVALREFVSSTGELYATDVAVDDKRSTNWAMLDGQKAVRNFKFFEYADGNASPVASGTDEVTYDVDGRAHGDRGLQAGLARRDGAMYYGPSAGYFDGKQWTRPELGGR
jgi:hypothetical protein